MSVDAGADLAGVTIAVDSGVGLGTTFLVTKGDLVGEPIFSLPGTAFIRKKTNAAGETEWTYALKGLSLVIR